MLYDRFDDMRSKGVAGGGDGYDLTKIGTKVSVHAMESIPKGKKWKGTKNTSVTYSLGSASISTFPYFTSDDCLVGIPTYNRNNAYTYENWNTYFYVYFFNSQNNAYEVFHPDFTSIKSEWGINDIDSYYLDFKLNEDGTILTIVATTDRSSISKIVIIEVDKINKTFTPRVFNLTNIIEMPSDSGGYYASHLITKNCIFTCEIHSGNDYPLGYYTYDIENHTLTFKNNSYKFYTISNAKSYLWDNSGRSLNLHWYSNSIFVVVGANNNIGFFTVSDSSITFAGVSGRVSPFTSVTGISNDGQYVLGIGSGLVGIALIDHVNHTVGTPITVSVSNTSYNSKMEGLYMINRENVFLLEGTTLSNIYTNTESMTENLPFRNIDFSRWINENSSNNRKLFTFASSDGNYLIYNDLTLDTTSDYAYGITSESLTIGDVSEAQLLWSRENETP